MKYAQSTHSKNTSAEKSSHIHTIVYYSIKWLLIILIVFLTLRIMSRPIRNKWSNNYLSRGDTFLVQKKYLSAIVEYQKAMLLNPENTTAVSHNELADNAESDVTVLENFYKDRGLNDKYAEFAKARTKTQNPAEATKISKSLIEDGEYQLAIIPAKLATQLDPTYQSGWVFLAIANLDVTREVEINGVARKTYQSDLETAKTHITDLPDILK